MPLEAAKTVIEKWLSGSIPKSGMSGGGLPKDLSLDGLGPADMNAIGLFVLENLAANYKSGTIKPKGDAAWSYHDASLVLGEIACSGPEMNFFKNTDASFIRKVLPPLVAVIVGLEACVDSEAIWKPCIFWATEAMDEPRQCEKAVASSGLFNEHVDLFTLAKPHLITSDPSEIVTSLDKAGLMVLLRQLNIIELLYRNLSPFTVPAAATPKEYFALCVALKRAFVKDIINSSKASSSKNFALFPLESEKTDKSSCVNYFQHENTWHSLVGLPNRLFSCTLQSYSHDPEAVVAGVSAARARWAEGLVKSIDASTAAGSDEEAATRPTLFESLVSLNATLFEEVLAHADGFDDRQRRVIVGDIPSVFYKTLKGIAAEGNASSADVFAKAMEPILSTNSATPLVADILKKAPVE